MSRAGWAFVAAIGVTYLVTSFALALLTPLLQWVLQLDQLVNRLTFPPPPAGIGHAATWGLSIAAGAGFGAGVARADGGRIAAGAYAAFLFANGAVVVWQAIEQQRDAIDSFTIVAVGNVPEASALMFLPAGIAVLLGWIAGGRARRNSDGPNAGLVAAGAYALVGMAAWSLISGRYFEALTASYSIVQFDAPLHAGIVAAQSAVAGSVFAIRAQRAVRARDLGLFVLIGIAGVLPTDIMPILLTLFLDWSYVPLSLALVPPATAFFGWLTTLGIQIVMRRTMHAPTPLRS